MSFTAVTASCSGDTSEGEVLRIVFPSLLPSAELCPEHKRNGIDLHPKLEVKGQCRRRTFREKRMSNPILIVMRGEKIHGGRKRVERW